MIQLNSKDLSTSTHTHLANVQQRIDGESDFLSRAEKAASEWNSKVSNKIKEVAFQEVKDTLISMCVGVEICNYCENNEATDIEHIYPKSLFPERAFRWDNYLLACGTCNSNHKMDKFAIFDPALSDSLFEIPRGLGKPVNDDGAMINPRKENPMDFFWLDIHSRTFMLNPSLGLDARNRKRAEYTLKLLGLNEREAIRTARKTAASFYIDRLERYVRVKETTRVDELLNVVSEPLIVDSTASFVTEQSRIKVALMNDIKQYSHPTVWQELKRQRHLLPKTDSFFNRAPEALEW